jgi:catechol 2,3-dioxygenase-like lactoylglutathione lyase family enzyme
MKIHNSNYFSTNSKQPSIGEKTNTMQHKAKSIRPFIGAKDFNISRNFYRDLGFEETVITHNMSVFKTGELAFYLQDADVKDWIDNTMIFLEVEDVDFYWNQLAALNLPAKYKGAKLSPIKTDYWGRECFLHDPSGILWHFGEFAK